MTVLFLGAGLLPACCFRDCPSTALQSWCCVRSHCSAWFFPVNSSLVVCCPAAAWLWMLSSLWAFLHTAFQFFYVKDKKGREMVLAVGNGRVISLTEVPWVRSSSLSSIALSPWFAVVEDLRLWWQNPVGLHCLLGAFLCCL